MTIEILYACIIAILVLLFVDFRQTIDIKNHPGMYEINPILGKHPSDTKITIYFIISSIIFVLVSLYLAEPVKYIWLAVWAGMEIWAIQNNIKLGLKI